MATKKTGAKVTKKPGATKKAKVKGKRKPPKEPRKRAAAGQTPVEGQTAAPGPQDAPQEPVFDDLRIVLTLKVDQAVVGMQALHCDPQVRNISAVSVLTGDIQDRVDALAHLVPGLVRVALAGWRERARNPKYERPAPPPPPPTPPQRGRTTTRRVQAQPRTGQQSLFEL